MIVYYDVDLSKSYPSASKDDDKILEYHRCTRFRAYKDGFGGDTIAYSAYKTPHLDYPDAKAWFAAKPKDKHGQKENGGSVSPKAQS